MHFGVLVELPALHFGWRTDPVLCEVRERLPRPVRRASSCCRLRPALAEGGVSVGAGVSLNCASTNFRKYRPWRDDEYGPYPTRSLTNILGSRGSRSSQLDPHCAVAKRGQRLVENCLSSRCGWQSSGQRFARGGRKDRATSEATEEAGYCLCRVACSEFRLGAVFVISSLTRNMKEQALFHFDPTLVSCCRGAIVNTNSSGKPNGMP